MLLVELVAITETVYVWEAWQRIAHHSYRCFSELKMLFFHTDTDVRLENKEDNSVIMQASKVSSLVLCLCQRFTTLFLYLPFAPCLLISPLSLYLSGSVWLLHSQHGVHAGLWGLLSVRLVDCLAIGWLFAETDQ